MNVNLKWTHFCLLVKYIHKLDHFVHPLIPNENYSKRNEEEEIKRVKRTDFYLHGLQISSVHIVGIVVQKKERPEKIQFQVDDGTGIIMCYLWFNKLKEEEVNHYRSLLSIASLVTVQGKVVEKEGVKYINVTNLRSFSVH